MKGLKFVILIGQEGYILWKMESVVLVEKKECQVQQPQLF